ncbi:uncharacterized protein RCC_03910 [Ramularia collo-cygni]|uniref:Metallo-beta-lactamase domain-containing protein n=1 Tax=Ramularia collo-cygni TaxID=112498 RepID=A0A2D3UP15_9PEZI|nr:uncharacterized protein RCC_03910 [Ramularia collo-cygni]CZT18072.1 uncharacterized protein RCC_03910 [Ramularia collo-cygni]
MSHSKDAASPQAPLEANVHTMFERSTGTYQWLVACPITKEAVVIDPVLDGRPPSNQIGIATTAADKILDLVMNYRYTVMRILETHSHGMPTSAWYLRGQLQQLTGHMPRICTGKSLSGVHRMFQRQYRIQNAFQSAPFDSGFQDNEVFEIGQLKCQVLLVSKPLETEKFCFVIGRHVFSGTVEGAAVEPASRRLSVLHDGHYFHPHGSRPGTAAALTDVDSRPVSSQTELSTWEHSPTELRRASVEPKRVQTPSRPHSQIYEMGV